MNTIEKLNYKNQNPILVLNDPEEVKVLVNSFKTVCAIHSAINNAIKYNFVLCFIKNQSDIEYIVLNVIPQLLNDAVFWVAYPKKTSKKYKCEIDRDHGWDTIGLIGYESVRMVAIDNDWSAIRFRHVDKIKKLTRNSKIAISAEGKQKSKK